MTSPVLEHVADRWPPSARAALPLVVREVVRAIAPHVGPESWHALASAVGESTLSEAELEPTMIATLYESVAEASGVSSGMAVELTAIVLLALGTALGPEARRRLAGELSPPWSGMLEHAPPVTAAASEAPAGRGHTLATGHAGSDRPLSSSEMPSAEPGRTLATSSGPAPERTLAGARRGQR